MGTKEEQQLIGLANALGDEKTKPQRGVVGRIWGAMGLVGHLFFRNSKDDFEKRLQHLSKEEVAAHTRLKRRTQFWRKFARNLIVYSVIAEILLLGIAIYSTRNVHMDWQRRAWRVSPVFALPLLTTLVYSSCGSLYRMRERKDHKTLERLRAERQEKIDELKEKTNYYLTQQLIQKYDVDPAAKAAAASVLASKLGSESGLKLALQAADVLEKEDAGRSPGAGQSNESAGIEKGDSAGLRNRRSYSRKGSRTDKRPSVSPAQTPRPYGDILEEPEEWGGPDVEVMSQKEEYTRGKPGDGGWLARVAAMLVGEDPSQCYALICGQCHMHNGLAKKEDFQYITYYCPHCHALNKANHLEDGDAQNRSGGRTGDSGGRAKSPVIPPESPVRYVARPDEGHSASGESSTQLQEQIVSEILTDLEVLPETQESRESQDGISTTPRDN